MIFDTRVNGVPCLCSVLEYSPYIPMRIYGPDIDQGTPPEYETFDYAILDKAGKPAPWLEKYLTDEDSDRLLEEYQIMQMAEYYTA